MVLVWNLVSQMIRRGCLTQSFHRKFHCNLSPIKPGVLLLRSSTDVKVQAAAFTIDQAMCEAEVKLSSNSKTAQAELEPYDSQVDISVNNHATHNELVVEVPDNLSDQSLCLNVRIPHHYSVEVASRGNNSIQICKLDCDKLQVRLDDGNCELISMKALETEIRGKNMNLVCAKSFVGNLTASVENGSIVADKLQGQIFDISAVSGNIHINSLYAAKSNLRCNHGDVDIKNCHGHTEITTSEGAINLKSVDGSLSASSTQGDMDIHLTSHTNVDLHTASGHVNITVPETICSLVNIQTEHLDVDDSLVLDIKSRDAQCDNIQGIIGASELVSSDSTSRTLNVRSTSLNIGVMDWISAQKLSFSEFDG